MRPRSEAEAIREEGAGGKRWRFRFATRGDLPKIRALLSSARLPLAGFEAQRERFLLAFRGNVLSGCALLERHGGFGLLRSVAVAEKERGAGLGEGMVRRLLARARRAAAGRPTPHDNGGGLLRALRVPAGLSRERAVGAARHGRIRGSLPGQRRGDAPDLNRSKKAKRR